MRARTALVIRHLVVAIALVVIIVWLWRIGSGELTPPTSLESAATWIDQHDAATLAFTLVRIEALLLAGYLLALTTASAFVRLLELPRATRLVDRLTLPVIRGILGGAAALGVMIAPAPLHRPAQTSTTSPMVTPPATDPNAHATLRLEGSDTDSLPPSLPLPAAPAPTPEPAPTDTWMVQPGDSLWSIAASHLEDLGGAPASERDVAVMWRRLIDLNRERLVNPDDPDLIFADQVFELPVMETG